MPLLMRMMLQDNEIYTSDPGGGGEAERRQGRVQAPQGVGRGYQTILMHMLIATVSTIDRTMLSRQPLQRNLTISKLPPSSDTWAGKRQTRKGGTSFGTEVQEAVADHSSRILA